MTNPTLHHPTFWAPETDAGEERSPDMSIEERQGSRALEEFEPFVHACAMAQEPITTADGERTALLLFLLGAAERFLVARCLRRSTFVQSLGRLLDRHDLPGRRAAALFERLPWLHRDPSAASTLEAGAQAFQAWLQGADPEQRLRRAVRAEQADWARTRPEEDLVDAG